MILPQKDFPPDIRVEKEVRALQNAGYRIFVLCDQIKRNLAVEVWKEITIIRRKRIPIPTLIEKFNGIPGWNLFLEWQWRRFIEKVVLSKSIDVIHIHDLPMARAAITVGYKYGLPVILDLHENYPASLKSYVEGLKGWRKVLTQILINTKKWEKYEIAQSIKANHIIVVVPEAKERLVSRGIPSSKITVIENTEDTDYFSNLPLDPAILSRYLNYFIILYIGGFGGRDDHRGLTTVIKAMPSVLKSIPNAKLLLVGRGSIKPILQEMIHKYSLDNYVELIDWVLFEKLPSYIAASSVCLVPHRSNPHTEATSPHKLFQYMLMGKPVIVSSCRPLKRIVDELGSGIVFQAGDSADLSRAIVQLKDEAIRTKLGERGRSGVLNKYNWNVTSKKLINLYKNLYGVPSHK